MEEENGQGRMMVRPEEQQKYVRIPSGYRFLPTDRELIIEYLRKKVYSQPLPFYNIYDVEINEYTPLQLFDNYGKEGDAAMYFFTSRDGRYPIGNRRIRAAVGGFWKATASKLAIGDENNPIGYKRALVYRTGTFEESTKSDWLMQEYTLPRNTSTSSSTNMKLNNFVLCKIYRKSTKSTVPSTISSASSSTANTSITAAIESLSLASSVPSTSSSTAKTPIVAMLESSSSASSSTANASMAADIESLRLASSIPSTISSTANTSIAAAFKSLSL